MASVEAAYPGQSATFEALFYNEDGVSPFAGIAAPSWVVRDPDGKLVVQGSGQQDSLAPARWTAAITIPTSAPPTDSGRRYSITWTIKNTAGLSLQNRDFFAVRPAVDFDIIELDRLAMEKSVLIDSIAVDSSLPNITQLQVRALTEAGEIIHDSGALTGGALPAPLVAQGSKVYTYQSPTAVERLSVDQAGFKPFVIEWTYTIGGQVEREFHFLYVVNPRILTLVHQLRRMVDKARNKNPNPALQYNDVDLVEYLNQGIQYVNFAKPTLTDWSVVSIPPTMHAGVLHAAAYSLLSAQYLAEGQSAFNFSGQAVSLEVDRTPFIDSALSRIMDFLQTQLPTAKRMWLRSSGATGQSGGVLGVNVGPSLGWVSQGLRYDRYRRFFAGVG